MMFNPEQIEAELERIQRQNSPTEARTAILNLVVFSRRETAVRTDEALAHVVGRRAARVIHVVPQDQPESDVSLSARCYLDRERKSVCIQEIVIENGADGVGAAPGTWTPLLIRDLPVYALWFDTLAANTDLLQDLQEQCDTLIVDSEQCVAFGESTREVAHTITSELVSRGVVVSDFVWQRLLPLRQITARYFDPPERRELLDQIRSVTLSGAPHVFAGLYLSWLAGRLNWYVEPDGVADHTGQEVTVRISTPGRERPAGETAGAMEPPGAPPGARGDETQHGADQAHKADQAHGADRAATGAPGSPPSGQTPTVHFTFDGGAAVTITGSEDGTAVITHADGPGEDAAQEEAAHPTEDQPGAGRAGEVVSYTVPSDGEIVISEIDAVRNENLYTEALTVLGRAPWAP